MSLSREEKEGIFQLFGRSEGDTGSMPVQIALLQHKIKQLTGHLRENKHDFATKRGLLKLVAQQRKYLRYLSRVDVEAYQDILNRLGLKR